jgi:hypothetical protein
LFKVVDKTPAQEEKLEKIAEVYRRLHRAGMHPIGAYAKHVLGTTSTRAKSSSAALIDDYMAFVDEAFSDETTDIMNTLKKWLTKELTEEPDYYIDTVYGDLRVRCRCDHVTEEDARERERIGRGFDVKDIYKELLDAVLTRFNAYEDKYEWD